MSDLAISALAAQQDSVAVWKCRDATSDGTIVKSLLGLNAVKYPYTYAWGNNEVRAVYKGQPCRVVVRGAMK